MLFRLHFELLEKIDEKLKEEGWFFTGLRPLCGDWEYMVLHNAGEVQIVWDNYVLSDEFKEIVNYIFERK